MKRGYSVYSGTMSFEGKKKELITLIFEEPRNSYRRRYFENVLDAANYTRHTALDPLDACLILDIALALKNTEWPPQKEAGKKEVAKDER